MAFADWVSIFANSRCITTIVERLIHRAEIVSLVGARYRVDEAEREAKRRKGARVAMTAATREP